MVQTPILMALNKTKLYMRHVLPFYFVFLLKSSFFFLFSFSFLLQLFLSVHQIPTQNENIQHNNHDTVLLSFALVLGFEMSSKTNFKSLALAFSLKSQIFGFGFGFEGQVFVNNTGTIYTVIHKLTYKKLVT